MIIVSAWLMKKIRVSHFYRKIRPISFFFMACFLVNWDAISLKWIIIGSRKAIGKLTTIRSVKAALLQRPNCFLRRLPDTNRGTTIDNDKVIMIWNKIKYFLQMTNSNLCLKVLENTETSQFHFNFCATSIYSYLPNDCVGPFNSVGDRFLRDW